jgi:hypothetical protein
LALNAIDLVTGIMGQQKNIRLQDVTFHVHLMDNGMLEIRGSGEGSKQDEIKTILHSLFTTEAPLKGVATYNENHTELLIRPPSGKVFDHRHLEKALDMLAEGLAARFNGVESRPYTLHDKQRNRLVEMYIEVEASKKDKTFNPKVAFYNSNKKFTSEFVTYFKELLREHEPDIMDTTKVILKDAAGKSPQTMIFRDKYPHDPGKIDPNIFIEVITRLLEGVSYENGKFNYEEPYLPGKEYGDINAPTFDSGRGNGYQDSYDRNPEGDDEFYEEDHAFPNNTLIPSRQDIEDALFTIFRSSNRTYMYEHTDAIPKALTAPELISISKSIHEQLKAHADPSRPLDSMLNEALQECGKNPQQFKPIDPTTHEVPISNSSTTINSNVFFKNLGIHEQTVLSLQLANLIEEARNRHR